MLINEKVKSILRKNKLIHYGLKEIYKFYNFTYLKFFAGTNKDIFTEIYVKNKWKDDSSHSGTGSNLEQTKEIIKVFPKFISNYKIQSILDIPCGDFYWMKEINFDKVNYIGGDIVPQLIKRNNELFSKKNIVFKIIDLTIDNLPKSDVIFCRDCLVHLSFKDIFKALNNIKRSNSKYLITTSFVKRNLNHDIATGSWRTINLCKKPFNFPDPILNINENCTEANKKYSDKVLSIWDINSIPDFK